MTPRQIQRLNHAATPGNQIPRDCAAELASRIVQLEAEILRLRTTETAAAHALDAIRQLLGLDLVSGEHPSVTRQRIEASLAEAKAEAGAYREALTPSSDTERAYYLQDSFEWIEESDDGRGYSTRQVPWDTTQDIMAAIRKRAEATIATPAADPQGTQEAP